MKASTMIIEFLRAKKARLEGEIIQREKEVGYYKDYLALYLLQKELETTEGILRYAIIYEEQL